MDSKKKKRNSERKRRKMKKKKKKIRRKKENKKEKKKRMITGSSKNRRRETRKKRKKKVNCHSSRSRSRRRKRRKSRRRKKRKRSRRRRSRRSNRSKSENSPASPPPRRQGQLAAHPRGRRFNKSPEFNNHLRHDSHNTRRREDLMKQYTQGFPAVFCNLLAHDPSDEHFLWFRLSTDNLSEVYSCNHVRLRGSIMPTIRAGETW